MRAETSGGEIVVSFLLQTCEHRQALSVLLISKKDQEEIWFSRFNISILPFSSAYPYWGRVGNGAFLRVNIVWGVFFVFPIGCK